MRPAVDPFAWRITAGDRVFVSRGGAQVAAIASARAARPIDILERGDEDAAQHALARVTGNFRRGNERT